MLKGTNIPHGRGIKILDEEGSYKYMEGWFSSSLLCGQGKELCFIETSPESVILKEGKFMNDEIDENCSK